MRGYVVGYYNNKAMKDDFVILTTMDSKNVAMFVRESYNDAYKKVGMSTRVVMLASREVPRNHRFAD